MATKPEFITKQATHQKTTYTIDENGEKVKKKQNIKEEVKYRIDADFVPTSLNDICIEFIMNYCEAHNEGEWLIEEVSKTVKDTNGKIRDYPFIRLRADFVHKFFPSIVKNMKDNLTVKEKVMRRFGK